MISVFIVMYLFCLTLRLRYYIKDFKLLDYSSYTFSFVLFLLLVDLFSRLDLYDFIMFFKLLGLTLLLISLTNIIISNIFNNFIYYSLKNSLIPDLVKRLNDINVKLKYKVSSTDKIVNKYMIDIYSSAITDLNTRLTYVVDNKDYLLNDRKLIDFIYGNIQNIGGTCQETITLLSSNKVDDISKANILFENLYKDMYSFYLLLPEEVVKDVI